MDVRHFNPSRTARLPAAWLPFLSGGIGAVSLFGGVLSFIGWSADISRLTDWYNNGISIQPNATVCVMSAGAALVLVSIGYRRAAAMLAMLILFLGASTIFQYLTGINLGRLNTLLMFERTWGRVGVIFPGRMGPPGAISWTLIGIALILASGFWGNRVRRAVPWIACLTLAIALLSITGYLYGANVLYSMPRLTVIALQTAIFIAAASLALIATVPEHEPMRSLLEPSAAGLLTRRALPILIILSFALGLMRIAIQNRGWVDLAFGTALRTLVEMLLLVSLLWWAAAAVRAREKPLFQSRELLRITLASIGDAVISTDTEARITFLNPVAESLTGWTNRAAVGQSLQTVFNIIDEDTRQPAISPVMRALREGLIVGLANHTVLIAMDGTERPIDDSAAPIRDDTGNIVGVVLVFHDISDRRKAVKEIERNERELSDFFESAGVGLHWVGPDGIILRVNQHELDLLGYTRDEYVGHHIAEFHADQPVIHNILACLTRGETLRDYPARLRRKDGSICDVLINSSARFEDGQFIHTRCFTHDNTERKLAEQRLLQAKQEAETANRAKDQFIAVLSHELRTPLTPVLLSVAELELNRNVSAEVLEKVKIIRRNVELERTLIDDLLDISRITSGKLRLSFDPLDVNELIRHVCEVCRSNIHERGIRLHCDLAADVQDVVGDPARLQQVFWNLLNNAAKFTPEGGEIYLTSENFGSSAGVNADDPAHGGWVRVTIRDTGIGIAPEALPVIFDAFQQAEMQVTRRFGGLGLGLSIAKLLIERHRGTIRAKSEGPGKGATFVVELPALSREQRQSAPEEPESPVTARPRPLRLMIVEDHADTASVLSRLLSASGHAVKTATTAAAALVLADQHPFDIVISDLGLPDMTGYELMQQIRDKHGIKGIAMSGYGMDEDIKKGEQAGFDDHLIKPVNFARLEEAIRRVAKRPDSEE